ncbi:SDR family oxidoreductase [Nocardia sp. NBC_01377]|uniref:SDR family oxidoreductase n=1 Tax=Nocardia sp. NBC_01377 TaxID=2903595 RepID=UPI003862FAF8
MRPRPRNGRRGRTRRPATPRYRGTGHLAALDDLHRTNIRGTFVVDQQAARRVRPGGAIINFSTSVVGTSFPEYSAYAASKGAVEAITMILARE